MLPLEARQLWAPEVVLCTGLTAEQPPAPPSFVCLGTEHHVAQAAFGMRAELNFWKDLIFKYMYVYLCGFMCTMCLLAEAEGILSPGIGFVGGMIYIMWVLGIEPEFYIIVSSFNWSHSSSCCVLLNLFYLWFFCVAPAALEHILQTRLALNSYLLLSVWGYVHTPPRGNFKISL